MSTRNFCCLLIIIFLLTFVDTRRIFYYIGVNYDITDFMIHHINVQSIKCYFQNQ